MHGTSCAGSHFVDGASDLDLLSTVDSTVYADTGTWHCIKVAKDTSQDEPPYGHPRMSEEHCSACIIQTRLLLQKFNVDCNDSLDTLLLLQFEDP